MKRQDAIKKLVQVGRNPKTLQGLTNKELLDAVANESEKLHAIAERQRLIAEEQDRRRCIQQKKQKRKAAAASRRADYNLQQSKAESFRLSVIGRPLPPIVRDTDRYQIQMTISDLESRYHESVTKFKKYGDQDAAARAREYSGTINALKKELQEVSK